MRACQVFLCYNFAAMNIAGVLLLYALAWHQPNKPDWQTGEPNAIANAAHYFALAVIGNYYPRTKQAPPISSRHGWYATSWAAEWALFIVGFGGVWIAIRTLVHLRESSERQLRAYVFPETADILEGSMINPPLPARTNFPWVFTSIKNSGQTPAYNVSSWLQIAVTAPANENTLAILTMQGGPPTISALVACSLRICGLTARLLLQRSLT